MRIGFTGSREGMTAQQSAYVLRALAAAKELTTKGAKPVFEHGDCIGADAQAFAIADSLGFETVARPCDMPNMRAHTPSTVVHKTKRPIDRNHDIVDATDILIAAPKTMAEEWRSGTWATVRYARKLHHTIRIVLPNGGILTQH